jgi:hypothetical protein
MTADFRRELGSYKYAQPTSHRSCISLTRSRNSGPDGEFPRVSARRPNRKAASGTALGAWWARRAPGFGARRCSPPMLAEKDRIDTANGVITLITLHMAIGLIPCVSPSSRADAVSAFRTFAEATRTTQSAERVISETNEARIVSLFNACCDALQIAPDDDVVPLFLDLTKLKAGMGPQDGLTRIIPEDAPGAAKDLLKIVYGFTSTKKLGREGGTLLPQYLIPLEPFCKTPFDRPNLVALGRLLHHASATDAPRVMPSSALLFKVAESMPGKMNKGTAHAAMSCYRSVRKVAIKHDPALAEQFGALADRRHVKGRGLLAVLAESDSKEHRTLGENGDLEEALRQVAPVLFAQVCEFVAEGRGMRNQSLSTTSLAEAWSATGNVAAALYDHRPTLLPTFELSDMWEKSVDVGAKAVVGKTYNEKFIPNGVNTVAVPLSRWLVEKMAEASRGRTGVSSGFPQSVYADFVMLWTITERLHGNDLRSINLPLWEKWSIQQKAVRQHMKANPVPRSEIPQKGSLRRMHLVSLPQVLCVGAPLLAREAERLLDRLESLEAAATLAGYASPSGSVSVSEALENFSSKAECYMAFVLPWALGLRNAQYINGKWGSHFQFERSDVGELTALRCSYTGELNDSARTKQGVTNGRLLGPGIISLRVLQAYLMRVRAPRLVRLGATPEESVAPNGRWPLFVGALAKSLDHCRMSSSLHSRDKYGATLYRVATEFLGHDLEPYKSLDRGSTWRGAWATHDIRKDVATIIGQLVGDWPLACALTSDTQDVLAKKYVVSGFLPSGRRGDWRNVHTYLPRCIELLRNPAEAPCPLDDPEMPLPPLVRQMLDGWAEEDRAAAKKAGRSKWGVADARLRPSRLRDKGTAGATEEEREGALIPVECQS